MYNKFDLISCLFVCLLLFSRKETINLCSHYLSSKLDILNSGVVSLCGVEV